VQCERLPFFDEHFFCFVRRDSHHHGCNSDVEEEVASVWGWSQAADCGANFVRDEQET
jgi:hypothetical protein